jgi:hypothetical protein
MVVVANCGAEHLSRYSLHLQSNSCLGKVPLRRVAFLRTRSILPNMLLRCILISLKFLKLRRVHMLHHVISLPLLEAKPQPLMTVILIIGLILVILNLHEVAILGRRVQRQRDEPGDSRCLWDQTERPRLLVLELDELVVGADDLVRLVDAGVEELW